MRERKTRCKVTEDTFKRICQVLKGNKKKKREKMNERNGKKIRIRVKRWL